MNVSVRQPAVRRDRFSSGQRIAARGRELPRLAVRAGAGRVHGLDPGSVLHLQRLAGNRATARLLQRCGDVPPERCGCHDGTAAGAGSTPARGRAATVQRLTEEEKGEDLRSSKYRDDPRLQAAFDNAPSLRRGERGTPVRLVQEGLVADGFALPRSTTPSGQLDGVFGGETQDAVRQFQTKYTADGLTDRNGLADGRVGRKTLGKLDDLAPAGDDDLPPCPILAGGDEAGGDEAGGDRSLVADQPSRTPGLLPIPGVTCDGKKGKQPPKPEDLCGATCGSHPWVQIKPGTFMSLCADNVTTASPVIRTVGCTPGRPGNVGLFGGTPGWQISGRYTFCGNPGRGIEVGFVQAVERAVNGGAYFDTKAKTMDKGQWECVSNARDCEAGAAQPWFGAANTPAGPQAFGGTFPILSDTPNRRMTSRLDRRRQLQQMALTGLFHVWLVARVPGKPLVFVHHWTLDMSIGAMLPFDADPCNITAWKLLGGVTVTQRGSGQGSATPVLAGTCANQLSKPCGP